MREKEGEVVLLARFWYSQWTSSHRNSQHFPKLTDIKQTTEMVLVIFKDIGDKMTILTHQSTMEGVWYLYSWTRNDT